VRAPRIAWSMRACSCLGKRETCKPHQQGFKQRGQLGS
jgi:predicted metal-binding protein